MKELHNGTTYWNMNKKIKHSKFHLNDNTQAWRKSQMHSRFVQSKIALKIHRPVKFKNNDLSGFWTSSR